MGNIYRAEILYKAGLHPEQPARTLGRAAFDAVWAHSVALLQRGFTTGSILTVRGDQGFAGRAGHDGCAVARARWQPPREGGA